MRCGIYVRRSARDAGESDRNGRSLGEQEADCRAFAERHGWAVAEVYAEAEGVSASRRSNKARPEWMRALADLRKGGIETLVVWELSRADRRGWAALDGLLGPLEALGRRIVTVDGVDLMDPSQRLANVIRAEMAREESEQTAKRVQRTKDADALRERWRGGVPPFGMRAAGGRLEPDPGTAHLARAIVDAVLGGRTLWAVTRALNGGRPIPGLWAAPAPRGGDWGTSPLSRWLRSPTLAGLATDRPRAAISEGGRYAGTGTVKRDPATGAPLTVGAGIVTPDEHYQLVRIVGSRSKSLGRLTATGAIARRGAGRTPAVWLLAGLARCHCGAPAIRTSAGRSLRCIRTQQGQGCATGHPGGGPVAKVEAHVRAAVAVAMALSPELRLAAAGALAPARPDTTEAERAVAECRRSAERLEDLLADGLLTRDAYARQVERLEARRGAAEATLALAGTGRPELAPGAVYEALRGLDGSTLVRLAVESVTLLPAPRAGAAFDPHSRVVIGWRDGIEPVLPAGWIGAAAARK